MTQYHFGFGHWPGDSLCGLSLRLFFVFYIAAFLIELYRIKSSNRILRKIAFSALLAGMIPHTVFIINNAFSEIPHGAAGAGLWFFILAWGLILLEVFLFFSYPKTPFGAFLLPAVLIAILAGISLADTRFREAGHLFGTLHGISLLTATIFLLYGFVTGSMFFLQRAKIKSKTGFLRGVPLPSLEWLRKSNHVSARLSLFFMGLGIFFGLVMRRAAENHGTFTSGDLMVIGGVSLFLLMAVALWYISKSDPGRNDSRTAVLCIVSFLILILILGYGSLNSKSHWLFSPNDEMNSVPRAAAGEESRP